MNNSTAFDVIAYICSKLGLYVFDNRASISKNSYLYKYSICKCNHELECIGLDIRYYLKYHSDIYMPMKLEENEEYLLLAKICMSRAFKVDDKTNLYIGNPFYGAWDKIKDAKTSDEAIILLDLYSSSFS